MVEEMDPKDKPDEETIRDDTKFDEWLKEFSRQRKYESIHGPSKKASDHQNVIVFHPEDEE